MEHLIETSVIERTEAIRRDALAKFEAAYDLLEEAQAYLPEDSSRGWSWTDKMIEHLVHRYRRDDADAKEKFLGVVTAQLDRSLWRNLIASHKFDAIMDKRAHREFESQLEDAPPALTASTAFATLKALLGDAEMLFKRGIAEAFSSLDRRFRSHDGFKIGSRIVLNNAFSTPEHGYWNHYRRHDDTIRDIERAFCRLDGRDLPERQGGIIGRIASSCRNANFPLVVEGEFFRVRIFKNGNIHLWFTRDDLVKQINLLLADHYGESLGVGPDVARTDPLENRSLTPAKDLGFFPTPEAVCGRLLGEMRPPAWDEPFRVLEPSAGGGAIAKAIRDEYPLAQIDCCELDRGRAGELEAAGFRVTAGDFLERHPAPRFDRIAMNPPFDGQRDIDHVSHAVKFLAPGGVLVSVMSAGIEFRENAKAVAFRALVERYKGQIIDLPADSFAESGTHVNTALVVLKRALD